MKDKLTKKDVRVNECKDNKEVTGVHLGIGRKETTCGKENAAKRKI